MARKKQIPGTMKFEISQYYDTESFTESDFETVQMVTRIPKFVKEEIKRFAKSKYRSINDMVADACLRLISGFNYRTAAEEDILSTIRKETQEHYSALASTIQSFKDDLENIAAPFRLVSEDVSKLRRGIEAEVHQRLEQKQYNRSRLALAHIVRYVAMHPNSTRVQVFEYLKSTLDLLPEIASQAIQEAIEVGLVSQAGEPEPRLRL